MVAMVCSFRWQKRVTGSLFETVIATKDVIHEYENRPQEIECLSDRDWYGYWSVYLARRLFIALKMF